MALFCSRLDIEHGFLVTDDDRVCPIISMTDANGEPTTDASAATAFMAHRGDCWIQGCVEDFPPPTLH